MDTASLLSLPVFVLICLATGASGAYFRPGAWYKSIDKPSWNPPDWLFAPAWAVIYALLALAAWMVWEAAGPGDAGPPMLAFGVQCVLNAIWSALFFGLRRIDLALFEVVALWGSIVAMIVLFAPISATAAWLLAPYLLWVGFAAVLNFALWRLNRAAPSATAS